MLRIVIKPLALVFTLATTLGVLMHDTRVDKASVIALAAPAVVATYGVAASTADFRGNEHTHSERATENLKRMVVAGLVTGSIAALTGLFVVLLAVIAAVSAPSYPGYYYY